VHWNWKASSDEQYKPAGILPPFGNKSQSRSTRTRARSGAWFAAILATGFAAPAQAQMFWPTGPAADYSEPPRPIEPRRPRIIKSRQKLPDAPKETAKPVGPIVIAISIEKQQLKLYDQNGLFAETPVSTGMRGHSTPMGVFSIIQKNKYHRSNIYSGAPMPYMQRITWSGVAMHAGVLPGYPASHGCIRMPMNFAMRMWGWTRMGARVIVTPGEVSPADFSHPLLIARKPETRPVAAAPDTTQHAETAAKSDRSSILDAAAHETPELRLTSITERSVPIRTADASGALPRKIDVVSDASATKPAAPDNATQDDSKKATDTAASVTGAAPSDVKPEESKSETKTEEAAGKESMTGESKVEQAKAEDKAEETKAGNGKSGATNTDESKAAKDQARATDPVSPSAPVSATPPLEGSAEFIGPTKPRSGHIAALVSRKENKIYVRQNFEPWFEAPVTIAASDRPLGTHVFTVRADKNDASALRWSVVSLPAPVRVSHADDDKPRRKRAGVAEVAAPVPPSSPAEALDRLNIPAETMTRIASALAPGASLVVSDQGLGDETGRGTDFIVPLR
jgi:lipoprotein-anchoring transpeptidase ErfK/SrfK